ncbi:hypothetical protein DITRI_Ditri06bG0053700 [Diplodiscus trichospermus]
MRGKRRDRLEISEIIKVGYNEVSYGSDASISDEDIEFRNSVIRNEAEETWKASAMLGIVFDKNKNQMIEAFQRMEEKDRIRRSVSAQILLQRITSIDLWIYVLFFIVGSAFGKGLCLRLMLPRDLDCRGCF